MLHTGLIAPVSELLERHSEERPDKVAYWDAHRSVTYADLARRTEVAAHVAAAHADAVDRQARFPAEAVATLGRSAC